MDLSSLELATDGVQMKLRNPETGAVLMQDDEPEEKGGKPVTITLVGQHTKAFREYQNTVINKHARKKNKTPFSAELLEEQSLETLARCTLGWDGIVYGGEPLEFTPDNVKWLYSEPRLAWVRTQVDEFLGDSANFLKPSQTS